MSQEQPALLNPEGSLPQNVIARMRVARKTKPVWAKRVDNDQQVTSLEGVQQLSAGDFLCRGIQNEYWPQSSKKLLGNYTPSGQLDHDGFERFDPKPDGNCVLVTKIDHPFRVVTAWRNLQGKAGDYVVLSMEDPTDIWIVDLAIFDASYEFRNQSP